MDPSDSSDLKPSEDAPPQKHAPTSRGLRFLTGFLAAALLTIFVARVVEAAWDKSAANDEPKHLLSGLAYLQVGWCCAGGNNTALVALAAIPERLFGRPEATQDATAIHLRYFIARLTNIPLVLLLGIYVFLWSRHLFGLGGGLVSLALLAFSPNIAAHAALVSPDFTVTALMLPASYHARLLFEGPMTLTALWSAAVLFFLAQIAKYTALLLVPALFLAAALSKAKLGERARRVVLSATIMLLGFAMVAVVYEVPGLFGDRDESAMDVAALAAELTRLPVAPEKIADLYREGKIPTGYMGGLESARHSVDIGYGTYLNGRLTPPRLLYYPEAFLIKTPIGILLLVVMGLFALPWLWRHRQADMWLLLLPVGLLWAAAMKGSLQLGVRHLIPCYPYLFVLAGGACLRQSWLKKIAILLAVGWTAWAGTQHRPHHLAYFNEIVGGPRDGHRYLIYENLDWGQDLRRLAAFQREHETGEMPFRYFGSVLPQHYGVQSRYMEPHKPMTGWIAISRSSLVGDTPDSPIGVEVPNWMRGFAWLDPFEPVAILGHSILVYHITQEDLDAFGMSPSPK